MESPLKQAPLNQRAARSQLRRTSNDRSNGLPGLLLPTSSISLPARMRLFARQRAPTRTRRSRRTSRCWPPIHLS